MGFILRNTTPDDSRKLPKSFHTYIVLEERGASREKIADVKWIYRPKNCGGSAWSALIQKEDQGHPVTVYSTELNKLCEIIRYIRLGEGEPPRHWR